MKSFLVLMLIASAAYSAAPKEAMPLWPHGVPGGKADLGPEKDTTTAKDNIVGGRAVIRIGNVAEPSMTFYPASGDKDSAAVVIFPGGGYRILALDLEGTEIAEWLNSIGVSAAVVKYRVPTPPNTERYVGPLQDAQRAVGLVRSNAKEWHVDPQRIGVLGFSAGGHLAALLSNRYEKRTYDKADAADDVSCRPDFVLLIYPAYLAAGAKLDELAQEFQVTAATAPTFLIQTEDDGVHVENSLVYYRALKDAKVPAEMHLFSTGGHGYGMRHDSAKPVTVWPALAEQWLRTRGIIR